MKIIKEIMIVVLLVPIFLMISGCSVNNNKSDKITIVSTNFPGYDFARAVGTDNIDLTMLLKPGSESHSYDPTPKDRIKIENSDIFIYTGGESDEWIKNILESIDTSNMKIIRMMDLVEIKEEEIVEGMQTEEEHDHEHDHDEKEYDEHVWTSPVNAKKIVEIIKDTLIEIDTENKEKYQNNENKYIEKLDQIDSQIKDIVSSAKRTELVFADRFPFRYFVDEYSLTYKAAFPGCSSDTEASAKTIAYLINKIKKDNIPVVFYLELSNQKIADILVEETNAKKLEFHSAHNITKKEFDSGITYVDIMNKNIINLKEALN